MSEIPTADYYRAKSEECSTLAANLKSPIAIMIFRALANDYFELASKTQQAALTAPRAN